MCVCACACDVATLRACAVARGIGQMLVRLRRHCRFVEILEVGVRQRCLGADPLGGLVAVVEDYYHCADCWCWCLREVDCCCRCYCGLCGWSCCLERVCCSMQGRGCVHEHLCEEIETIGVK